MMDNIIDQKQQTLDNLQKSVCYARLGELVCFSNMLSEMQDIVEHELENRGY